MMLKQINNNRGAALITAYFVITSLITMGTGFAMTAVNELNAAKRHRDSTKAFWLAEAGIQQFLKDTTMLDENGNDTITVGGYSVYLIKDDSDPAFRYVTSSATVNGIQRQVEITFPAIPPDAFSNTISTGGNLHFTGNGFSFFGITFDSELNVHEKTRISGTYIEDGSRHTSWFEDRQEGVSTDQTTLTYPDSDSNGTPDEYNDFVEFNRNLLSNYSEDEYVYITPGAGETVSIWPNQGLVDKKIVYVEGPSAGEGDVQIYFDATGWQDNQNLTIISTGSVTYVEPLEYNTENSKLNVITWEGYTEASLFLGKHNGTIYSHDDINYYEILDHSNTYGNAIANDTMNVVEYVASKTFHFIDPLADGTVPPGFEGLLGPSGGGYKTTPTAWKEL